MIMHLSSNYEVYKDTYRQLYKYKVRVQIDP